MASAIGHVAALGTWKRRSYLIDRGFQLKYALWMALGAGVIAAAVGLWLAQAHVQALAGAGLDYVARRSIEAGDRVRFVLFSGAAVVLAMIVGAAGVRLTHRVAGPAMVVRRYLRSLALGRYPVMRPVRSSDELSGVVLALSGTIEQLRARDVRQVETLEDAIIAMRGALDRSPELRPMVERLEREVDERRTALEAGGAVGAPAGGR